MRPYLFRMISLSVMTIGVCVAPMAMAAGEPGTCENPLVIPASQNYGDASQRGMFASKPVNSVPTLGTFSQPVTVQGTTMYQWVAWTQGACPFDGHCLNPIVASSSMLYATPAQRDLYAARTANSIRMIGSYSQPLTVLGSTVYKWVEVASCPVRPSYNQGTGFYVLDGKLYDANGIQFHINGINKLHADEDSPGLANSHANAVRWNIDFSLPVADNIALLQGGPNEAYHGTIYDKMVPIPGNWDGTNDEDPATLTRIVDTWVAQAAGWNQLERYAIINIANEWGPDQSTVWRDSYITAIGRMRAAGYHAPLFITSGGSGQDTTDLLQYAQAVFNSDPEKNVIFDQHIYGFFYDSASGVGGDTSWQTDLGPGTSALAATGLAIVYGEFGPGRNIGPSPTLVSPTRIMQVASAAGFGWMAWAWDDHDDLFDDEWFALSYHGAYTTSADLTTFGKAVVEDASYGLKKVATPASIFLH